MTELVLFRHAPAEAGGRLAGRRDVPARLPDPAAVERLRARIGQVERIIASPALRCRQTAEALFPGSVPVFEPRLWEQDFGEWEGAPPASLPDHGPLDRLALANLRPPGGESFADLYRRTAPAIEALCTGGRVAVVAHAGTVRVALSLALGQLDAGLGFEVAELSCTRLRAFGRGQWSIVAVNTI